jgi:hypothetical protein
MAKIRIRLESLLDIQTGTELVPVRGVEAQSSCPSLRLGRTRLARRAWPDAKRILTCLFSIPGILRSPKAMTPSCYHLLVQLRDREGGNRIVFHMVPDGQRVQRSMLFTMSLPG